MNFKRIGRILVCLLLVCALLINISPIRAKAVVTELTLAQWGVIAIASLLAAGITINISEQFELEAMGSVFETHMANAAKKQQLDEDILDITFGIVLIDDTPQKKLPFNSDPDGFGWVILGLITFFDLFSRLGDETIPVKAPSFGTVDEGEIVSHGQYGYEVVSSSAPVYYYIWCSPRSSSNRHGTVFYSTKNFSVASNSSHSINTYEITRNGVNAFYAYEYLSWDGYCAQCSFHLEAETLEETRLHVCSLVADGEPVSELSATIVDNTVQAALQGATVVDSLYVPDIDISSISSLSAITGINNSLANGELSFEDLLQQLTGGETITVNPGSGLDPDPGTGTDPDPGIGGDPAELNWWDRFAKWFSDLRTSINELPNKFDEHFENLNNNIQEVPNKFETWIQNVQTSVDSVAESILGTADEINAAISNLPNAFSAHVQNILSAIAAVPQAILSGLQTVLQNLFVPDPDYFSNKIRSLVDKFGYLEPIISLGDTFKVYLTGVNPTPPVIWIDLGASAWYPLGGRVKFLDLTWYAQYKPTVDGIIGAFLWLWFLWRLFQAAPGIIQGSSGIFGNPDPHPDKSFNVPNWPTGQRLLQSGSFYHFRGSGDKHKFNE